MGDSGFRSAVPVLAHDVVSQPILDPNALFVSPNSSIPLMVGSSYWTIRRNSSATETVGLYPAPLPTGLPNGRPAMRHSASSGDLQVRKMRQAPGSTYGVVSPSGTEFAHRMGPNSPNPRTRVASGQPQNQAHAHNNIHSQHFQPNSHAHPFAHPLAESYGRPRNQASSGPNSPRPAHPARRVATSNVYDAGNRSMGSLPTGPDHRVMSQTQPRRANIPASASYGSIPRAQVNPHISAGQHGREPQALLRSTTSGLRGPSVHKDNSPHIKAPAPRAVLSTVGSPGPAANSQQSTRSLNRPIAQPHLQDSPGPGLAVKQKVAYGPQNTARRASENRQMDTNASRSDFNRPTAPPPRSLNTGSNPPNSGSNSGRFGIAHSRSFPNNLNANLNGSINKLKMTQNFSGSATNLSHTPPADQSPPPGWNHNLPLPRQKLETELAPLPQKRTPSGPSGPLSTSSSRQSIYSATRKLFSSLRSSRSASQASIASNAGTISDIFGTSTPGSRAASPTDDWSELVVEKEPSDVVVAAFRQIVNIPDDMRDIDLNLRKPAITGLQAAKTASLTEHERTEVLKYKEVFYTGPAASQKRAIISSDDQGNYRPAAHDHIAYRYEIVSELGKGSFGTVYKCRDHKSGRLVAVKVTANRKGLQQQARVEAGLLKKLTISGSPDRDHFVRYIDHFVFREHMCICTEMLSFNLYDMLRANRYKGMEIDLVRYVTRQLLEGLEFLDREGIIHCDLKPENILLSNLEFCQVKIIDFGSGCHETKKVFTYIQSRFYRAPEILLGIPYGQAIDMWSLGCIVPELIRGKPLFPGEDEADQVACIAEVIGVPDINTLRVSSRGPMFFDSRGNPLSRRSPKGVVRGVPGSRPLSTLLPADAADFVADLLHWSPQKRISAGGALYHKFIYGQ